MIRISSFISTAASVAYWVERSPSVEGQGFEFPVESRQRLKN